LPAGISEAPTVDGLSGAGSSDSPTLTRESGSSSRGSYTGPKEIAGYKLLRELGAGGMGAVFEAFDARMNRRVALKILARHQSESEKAADRFAREAWIAGKLSHPNLVRVFERGEEAEISYYTMELVDGGAVSDVLKNLRTWGKDDRWGLVFGTREYLSWAIGQIVEAARGLEYAHRQGVVHRDIKPMNLLLSREPAAVKVADFGLALDLGATRMTTVGKVMGTVAYMAPEQIRGQTDQISPRTDVYALGVTLFEMLTLELPFAGETQQIYMNAVLTAQARRPRKLNERVGRDLEVVLQKALEKDPADRYASAGAFAEDLENVLHFRPIQARPPGPAVRMAKWARRRPMHAALAAVLVAGLPTIGTLSLRAVQHQRLVLRLQVDRWREESIHFLHKDRFQEALEPLDRILGVRPEDVDALRDRAMCFARLAMAERNPERRDELRGKALSDITRVVARIPDARWPYRVRGYFLKSFGREREAAEDEQRAAERAAAAPQFYDVQMDGILALMARNYPQALKLFDELNRRRPDFPEARWWRGRVYENVGETAKAMTDYEVAVALKPRDSLSRLNLARLKTQSGSVDEAAALIDKVLELEPGSADAYEALAANHLAEGRAKASAGDSGAADKAFRQAEESARKALSLNPGLSWARVNLGAGLMEMYRLHPVPGSKQAAEATALYGEVIRMRESNPAGVDEEAFAAAMENQCDALIQLRELEKALEVCRDIARRHPDRANAHYNLAGVLALSGRPEEAIQALEEDFKLGDRDWQYLGADGWFESMRARPQFQALLQRMKSTPAP
jgi:tetratricopeptide (TPR) repeat protein